MDSLAYTAYTVKVVARGVLQRDVIVRRALQIADAEGLGAVSFRRLAAEFAVTPMALYRHVRDRADLIDAIADLVLAQIELPPPVDRAADWAASLRHTLRSAGRVFADHPAAPDLLRAGTGLAPNSLRLTEGLLGLLVGAGFSPAEALVIVQQLSALMLAEPVVIVQRLSPLLRAPRARRGKAPRRVEDDEASAPAREPPSAVAPSLDAYPYLSATLPHAQAWVDEVRDRDFGVEILLAGIETLLERRRAGGTAPADG